MGTRKNLPIRAWSAGDSVTGFALLTKKEQRQDRNGKTFLDLELADATGSIAAKVWADSPALAGNYEVHRFVAFRGAVKSYKDQLQLSIDDCRLATDDDRRHGFDESLLIPSTREDIGDLQRRLDHLMSEVVERPILRRLAAETLAVHGLALSEHPAAKGMHHAYRGGLLEHVVSMAELAVLVAGHYRELDRDLMLIGVLFHDLGKLLELGAMPANDYTLVGRLVGHVVIGRDLLRERCAAIPDFPADLQLHLEHLVLSHQGKREFASPVEPMTAEALALHFIDDLDSKINQLRAARENQPGLPYLKGLGRTMYLPALPGDAPAHGADATDIPIADPAGFEPPLPPSQPSAPSAPSASRRREPHTHQPPPLGTPLATLGALASLKAQLDKAPADAESPQEESAQPRLFDLDG